MCAKLLFVLLFWSILSQINFYAKDLYEFFV